MREGNAGFVLRRNVIFVEGYDPRGAQGYFDLLRRTCDQFQHLWPVSATLRLPRVETADFARWRLDVRGSDWQTATDYEFLRLEDSIRFDLDRSTARQLLCGLRWLIGDLLSGALFRIFWASWRFGLHLLHFQVLLLAWVALPAMIAVLVGGAVIGYLGFVSLGVLAALVAAFAFVLILRPIAEKSGVVQISNCWAVLRKFARGGPTWIDHRIEIGARRVLAVARANESDELAVVGHSSGGVVAAAIMDRALELDPDLGRNGIRLVLLTLGSVMPAVALHPAAARMRDIVRRLAVAPALTWVDCQSRKDVMCFANFDPVDGVGVEAGKQRRNPLIWRIRFRDMIAPEKYSRFSWNHLRVHYQYILAGDQPAPYDYVLLVGGPMPIADWPKRGGELLLAFARNEMSRGGRPRDHIEIGACP